MSTGPLWSDMVQRITINHDSGKVICVEDVTGKEPSKHLRRALPEGVKTIRTIPVYKKVAGHPDPGVSYNSSEDKPPADEDEDGRVIRRTLAEATEGDDQPLQGDEPPPPRSRVFGVWVADKVTEWGDKARFPVIAN